jgi:site-specific DNA recombinase
MTKRVEVQQYALRAVIYLRVSTAGQVNTARDGEGFSIPAQREACLRRAEELGAVFVDEYIDAGESARSVDRPQLQAMLERLTSQRDIDIVIVHKVDRLARNRADDVEINLTIRRAGARLVSVTENIDETPTGMLLHGIMSTIAEFYSGNLATEIRKGMSQKAKKGGMVGRAPIGYLNVQHFNGASSKPIREVILDPERADLVRWAFEAYATGEYTIKQLAEELGDRGLRTRPTKTKSSQPLYPQHVHKMLTRRVYVGLIEHQGEEYRGTHEPLVTVETFATVQAILHSRAQSREKSSKHGHYLRGSLFCKRCGSSLGFVKAHGRSATYDYFFCWTRHRNKTCNLPYVSAEVIESQVESLYKPVQVSAQVLLKFQGHILDRMERQLKGVEDTAKQARKRILHLEAERRKVLQAHLAGAVPLDLLKEEQDRIGRELAQAGSELANSEVDWESVRSQVNAAISLISQLHDLYIRADLGIRRRINQACWDGFDVDAEGVVGGRMSDPMAALVAEDVVQALGAAQGIHEPFEGVSPDDGSRLSSLVEVKGLEPSAYGLQSRRSSS